GPWIPLGQGQRKNGGWELTRQNLAAEIIGYIRARGYYRGGTSTSITESIRQFYLPNTEDETFCVPIRAANSKIAVICL
ncbi:MAG: hypothetical protein MK188_14760, partial [Gammaproteobacteria bacterium]|nr:hypothetical protein [Gammaproteobacteria bacterium]